MNVFVKVSNDIDRVLEVMVHTFKANWTIFTFFVSENCVSFFLFLWDFLFVKSSSGFLWLSEVFDRPIKLFNLRSKLICFLVFAFNSVFQERNAWIFWQDFTLVVFKFLLKVFKLFVINVRSLVVASSWCWASHRIENCFITLYFVICF